MKTRRKTIIISIAVVVTILLIAIGLSYAYFTANITGAEEGTTITVTGGVMNIVYNGGEK